MGRLSRMLWRLLAIPLCGYVGLYAWAYWQNHSATLCHITFVPFGDFSEALLLDSAHHAERTFGVRITVHPAIPIEEQVINYPRGQLVGEGLISLMKQHMPDQSNDEESMLVGFTRGDMYTGHKSWKFAFAVRESGRFAVISTARMDPETFGLLGDEDVLRTRLRKMVTKQVGLYFYGLPERQEKTSVLFSPILGLDDLDDISSELDATDRYRMTQTNKSCQL